MKNQKTLACTELPKTPTRINGLDDILLGGVAIGRTTLLIGSTGCGKSMMGLEFVYRSALAGESAIFVSFEERIDAIKENAQTLGWDLSALETEGKLAFLDARLNPEVLIAGDFNMKGLMILINAKAKMMGAKIIVLDAIDVLLRYFNDPNQEIQQLSILHEWLLTHKMTSMITMKLSKSSNHEFMEYMVDCAIYLDQRIINQISTRRIRIIKYRGSNFSRNEYPFVLSNQGIYIIPTSSIALEHKALGDYISCGHPRLDQMLGGGIRQSSCVLITGSSGTGKTTLACLFANKAAARNEKCLYISFEESQEAIISTMLSPGIDLREMVKNGNLSFLNFLPESVGSEEHLFNALTAVNEFKPRHVIVDAISACQRMGGDKAAYDYLIRLLNALKALGITCIFINQLAGSESIENISGIGISSLVDTVLYMRFIEADCELNRLMMVVKSRGSNHLNQYREYSISDNGINITDAYLSEGKLLTGQARQKQEFKDETEKQYQTFQIQIEQAKVLQKQRTLEAETGKLKAEIASAENKVKLLQLEKEMWLKSRSFSKVMGNIGSQDGNHSIDKESE